MNPYLAKLRNLKNHYPEAPSKPSKPITLLHGGGFEGFEGESGSRFFEKSGGDDTLVSQLDDLERRCPDHVPVNHWQQAVEDGRRFLTRWGDQAERLGWTARDLFGLHQPPAKPHPSYSRLSRYDAMGLIWLLRGRPVTVLTENTAAIENPTGAITIYRRCNKPALGPVGDSLEDFK